TDRHWIKVLGVCVAVRNYRDIKNVRLGRTF
ncbi:MAG: hypothetical protein ACJAYB_002844, partial [Psychromonas sp.]